VGSKPLAGGLVIATINMLVVAGYCVPERHRRLAPKSLTNLDLRFVSSASLRQ